jgi:hypothetical protein
MPRLLTQFDAQPAVPPIAFSRWAQFSPPWFDTVVDAPVDAGRTLRLADYDARVRTSPSTPLQNVGTRLTTVASFTEFKWHRIPLPELVWILRNGDDQWFGQSGTTYWEVSALGPTLMGFWRADSVRVWDVTKPWWETRGVAGGAVPIWAMTPTVNELRLGAGGVRHSLALSVAGDYSPERVPGTLKSDGTDPSHPLRSGECLRLTAVAYDRRLAECSTADDRATVHALRFHGCRVNDKTSATAGHNLRTPVGANITVQFRLTDFEVVLS